MKAMVCELCGGNELIKEGEYFVCQHCGTKYSLEDAKKLFIEVNGTIKVDESDKLKNLLTLAKRAVDSADFDGAQKYYKEIQSIDPDNWEAFYMEIFLDVLNGKLGKLSDGFFRLGHASLQIYELIDASDMSTPEKIDAISQVSRSFSAIYVAFSNQLTKLHSLSVSEYQQVMLSFYNNRELAADNLLKVFGDSGDEYTSVAISAYKNILEFLDLHQSENQGPSDYGERVSRIAEKVKQYEPDFVHTPKSGSSGGCYIATAVYGSYDCPEVWVLRRYRDNVLADTFAGRLFIKTYYAVSPTIVKWFGASSWFNDLWRPILDKMVLTLKGKGFEDTRYNDKCWR